MKEAISTCPYCGHEQFITNKAFVFDIKDAEFYHDDDYEVIEGIFHYECSYCGGVTFDAEQLEALWVYRRKHHPNA